LEAPPPQEKIVLFLYVPPEQSVSIILNPRLLSLIALFLAKTLEVSTSPLLTIVVLLSLDDD